MLGTASTETRWLFVEHPGAWGAKALEDSRLAPEVKHRLTSLEGVRVQLIRRHGRDESTGGVRVFAANVEPDEPTWIRTMVLETSAELAALRWPGDDASGWTEHTEPLWFVCANGARDLCCAEQGRPVAAELAERWPEATWETTHLGGHRFAATLLALPSGVMLGRLTPADAIEACEQVAVGRLPESLTRGRIGLSPAEQAAEAHVAAETNQPARVQRQLDSDGVDFRIAVWAVDAHWEVTVRPSESDCLASCGAAAKQVTQYRVVDSLRSSGRSPGA